MIDKFNNFNKKSYFDKEVDILKKPKKDDDQKIRAKFALYLTILMEDLKIQGMQDRELAENLKGILVGFIETDKNTLLDFYRIRKTLEVSAEPQKSETYNTHEVTGSDNFKQQQFELNFN